MISAYLQVILSFSRDGRLYLLTSALLGLTFWGGIFSVLGNLYLLRLGYGLEFIGTFNAAGALGYTAFALPAAALGRRWGSRRAVVYGLSVATLAGGLLPLAELSTDALQAVWLIACFLSLNAGLALYLVNGNPFLMTVTVPEDRNHAFSVSAALYPLAAVIGSVIGGVLPEIFAGLLSVTLDHPAPYRYPLFIAAGLLVPGIVAMLATGERGGVAVEAPAAERNVAPIGLIALLAFAMALRIPAEAASRTFLNVYMDDALREPITLIGGVLAIGQLVAVPAALATPLLIARWGIGRAYLAGSLGTALFTLPLALVPHWTAASFGFAGVMAASSVAFPAIVVYAMLIVPVAWRTTSSAVIEMAAGVGLLLTAFAGGYVIAALGYSTLFLISSALAFLGTLLFWLFFRVPRGELSRDPPFP